MQKPNLKGKVKKRKKMTRKTKWNDLWYIQSGDFLGLSVIGEIMQCPWVPLKNLNRQKIRGGGCALKREKQGIHVHSSNTDSSQKVVATLVSTDQRVDKQNVV